MRKRTGQDRKRKQKVSTSEAAAGAKLGGTKGNEQKAEYKNLKGKHGKPGETEGGKPGSESGRETPDKPL